VVHVAATPAPTMEPSIPPFRFTITDFATTGSSTPAPGPIQQQHHCHQQFMCPQRGPGGLQSKDVRWNGCRKRRERENYNSLLSPAHHGSIRLFYLRHRRIQSQLPSKLPRLCSVLWRTFKHRYQLGHLLLS
jgi:hypothetical protein